MNLPTVTYEQFLGFGPCWVKNEKGRRRLRYYSRKLGGKATALDILLLNRIPAKDRLWAVLREDFIPANTLHEFACRCAEKAMALAENPDPRSIAAIDAKRKWMRGEITDGELAVAQAAARDAAWDATSDSARAAAFGASLDAAFSVARAAVRDSALDAVRDAVLDAVRAEQAKMLIDMLEAI